MGWCACKKNWRKKIKMKKVSICIPTYSRLAYLQELVRSCLYQQFKDFEICISQDVTPNGIVAEIQNYCHQLVEAHPEFIRYQAQKVNLGLAGNWNALVHMAQGEYIYMPGDDDLINPDFLEKMFANSNDNADVIFCNQVFINAKSEILRDLTLSLNNRYKRNQLKSGWLTEPIRNVLNNSIPMSAAIIKHVWLDNIKFDIRLNSPELEVFLKIAVAGGRFYYLNEQLASYRIHEGSETATGLTIGQFLANIIDIEVPEIYEYDKVHLITNAIIPGINNAIKCKNVTVAKKLIDSGYYPKHKYRTKLMQYILINLPNALSILILTKLR